MQNLFIILTVLFSQMTFANVPTEKGRLIHDCGGFEVDQSQPETKVYVYDGKTGQHSATFENLDSSVIETFQQLDTPVEQRGLTYWAESNCACVTYYEGPCVKAIGNICAVSWTLLNAPKMCKRKGHQPKHQV